MSRLGKNAIQFPANVEVSSDGVSVRVKGPKGEIARTLRAEVTMTIGDHEITLVPANNSKFARSLWGTYAAHIRNMVKGVVTPFEKKLQIEGVGYRAEMTGKQLVLSLGFSHKINVEVPAGLTVTLDKNIIMIVGADKEAVGHFAAKIRNYRKPEPYQGKGIRYEGEVIRMKEGKKTA
jgi:large subunit ribosomal protein L6